MHGDKAQIKAARVSSSALTGESGKRDDRWWVRARVHSIIVAEAEAGAVSVVTRARAKKRCGPTIYLAGAVVARATCIDERKASYGISHHKLFRATRNADAATEKSAEIVWDQAIAKATTHAAGTAGRRLHFENVCSGAWER